MPLDDLTPEEEDDLVRAGKDLLADARRPGFHAQEFITLCGRLGLNKKSIKQLRSLYPETAGVIEAPQSTAARDRLACKPIADLLVASRRFILHRSGECTGEPIYRIFLFPG